MWRKLGQFILNYRWPLLIILAASTALMAYWGLQVQLSYDFTRAIPADHPANITYQQFKNKYGQDGNLMVVGIQTDKLFEEKLFNEYAQLQKQLKRSIGVTDVISVPSAITLLKDSSTEKLNALPIFPDKKLSQEELDSCAAVFRSLPFYHGLLYNPQTNAYLMGVSVEKTLINSKKRNDVVSGITTVVADFEKRTGQKVYLSGLPLIRTEMSTRIANEMQLFLLASVVLSALILLLFFRSFSSMILSLAVVIIGVLFSMGTMHLFHYKITLLTALIPPLLVVIGIPNCIYFLNKYHTAYNDTGDRRQALITMVGRMGIVTLFCNLAAGIGFAVFALTKSEILQEFGVVAGINIMALFLISLILIPTALSLLPVPKARHMRYLENARLNRWLDRLEVWALNHRKLIYTVTIAIVAVATIGIFKLKSVGYIVDDIPKTDKIYTDLKFFESNFKGVMPLEILVADTTKKKYGITRNLNNLLKMDSLSAYVSTMPSLARPLSITEGLKFAKQAFYEGDSANYAMPSDFELPALAQYLNFKKSNDSGAVATNSFTKLVSTFIDSNGQEARISINMADVGSARLPLVLDSIQKKVDTLFPKNRYDVRLTGTSITFLEGSAFIINGLKESIFWAFLLIALCMLYLFKSFRILMCSLIPNVIPLVITAGVMGWVGVPLKPSTVLVFSVALGIAIDITIRFLINYKQELPHQGFDRKKTVIETIHSTGISIIYTSLVLIAGFIIFSFSGFGGTKALGWLTSLTLITATLTNLVLLPALLIGMEKKRRDAQ
ncbi:efflux RND transporter permease subunit [Terrimonas sp. NA20]|uniref:Efflux RND transporter permease subunit n=1 Tax=Terrimonas ginsenosidimutans TaxID=2908004 RepID=A0ABS9KQ68_9BACT|nr:efflux RND transporter permease subunit [Terrimonas ginsenosidimutans]MCG2614468.1 efflux RND transporter permease subunit [Terrimonas ginsenosidimutans]